MKEIWAKSSESILQEIDVLIHDQIPITVWPADGTTKKAVTKSIEKNQDTVILVFEKQEQFKISKPECIFFYKLPGQLTRCFQGRDIRESDKHLGVAIPDEILQIQKRKYPRISTPGKSSASFVVAGKQRLLNCRVINVSLEGVKLSGQLPKILKDKDLLQPLTLNLCLHYSNIEQVIHVSEARIAWVNDSGQSEIQVGVYFRKEDSSTDELEHYIMLRQLEGKKF